MASLDINQVIKQAMAAQLAEFKDQFREELRILQDEAWKQGYAAADSGSDESTNPYSKE